MSTDFLWHVVNARPPLINADSWYWDKNGRWSVPMSTSFQLFNLTLLLFSVEQLAAICQDWKALVACSRFFQTSIHGCLTLSDSAVHEPSAVTSHWARKQWKSSPSLIDTLEKSLLVALLTQDIIRWQAVHWPEKDIVKLRKHYRQWSQFNVIESCLPKCYLIARLLFESFMQLCAADKHSTVLATFPY